ncbi:MAG: Transcriptional regulator [Desulfotomaculum sp. 46_296]|nr:MAG: Transcriptional regulator [Desulfotomaculum sp. 46_296]HAU32342.1 hypothetical protein [Desulfotomaculum sp.]
MALFSCRYAFILCNWAGNLARKTNRGKTAHVFSSHGDGGSVGHCRALGQLRPVRMAGGKKAGAAGAFLIAGLTLITPRTIQGQMFSPGMIRVLSIYMFYPLTWGSRSCYNVKNNILVFWVINNDGERKMTLTRRRKEFLNKIVNLFHQTGLPVHYATVGEALKVSKWTAYDILRELEKQGFLRAEYSVGREVKNPGRSMVMFLPTAGALRLYSSEAGKALPLEEWSAIKEKLLDFFDNMKSTGTKKVIDNLMEEMSRIETPVTFSAYTIALLVAYLKNLGSRSADTLLHLLTLPSKPEMTLIFFAGTVIGTMTKNMKEVINGKSFTFIRRFHQYLSECDAGEKKLLLGFLNEALERAF